MNQINLHKFIAYAIALVWIINGLLCKVLNLVPRHQEIVAAILGENYAKELTIAIGFGELIMAAWILSNWKPRLNAFIQIMIVAIMNTLEFILVPHLLLWGRWNAVFAAIFLVIVYVQAFKLHSKEKIAL